MMCAAMRAKFLFENGPVLGMLTLCMTAGVASAEFKFRHHFGDRDIPAKNLGQTALADLDRDGDLDFVTGEQMGRIFWYEYRGPNDWVRHVLGEQSPSDVGAEALDVNGDGWPDLVCGGAWYENPKNPRSSRFIRRVFDPQLAGIHDLLVGDVNGDGRLDVVTMSDRNDVRWYEIPGDALRRWPMIGIGEPVHSGISLGDIDRDGDLDVVRSNLWFENDQQARAWTAHVICKPWGATEPPFAVNATQTRVADLNSDGRPDVAICDGENSRSKMGWLEAPPDPRTGPWRLHEFPRGDNHVRGALHSLVVEDFDLDGDLDVFTVEMERFPGELPPRWFIWENTDGKGSFVERVILDARLGGHEAVAGDVDGDGDIDLCSKPWNPMRTNAVGGKYHFSYLENLAVPARKALPSR